LWVRSVRTGEGAIPFPTPEEATQHRWTDEERALLQRPATAPWTPADVPLLEEADELLGVDDTAERTTARRDRQREDDALGDLETHLWQHHIGDQRTASPLPRTNRRIRKASHSDSGLSSDYRPYTATYWPSNAFWALQQSDTLTYIQRQ